MDGGSLGYDYDSLPVPHANGTDYEEASACAPAFQVLKQLIQRCISDAVASGNVFADAWRHIAAFVPVALQASSWKFLHSYFVYFLS